MTRAEILSLMRDVVKQTSTATQALLSNTGNALRFINEGAEKVVMDLLPHMPQQFIKTKTISLVADQAGYSLASTMTATTLTLIASSPPTIVDSGSAFITNQFRAGMTIKLSGSTADDGNYTIESVAAGTLTLDAGETMTGEDAGNSITITELNPFYQIYKIERNTTDRSPREIEIINPLEHQFYMNVGETEASPSACWFEGDTLYFKKTPSTTTSNYAKVYLVPGEAVTVPTNGPKLIPQPFHSCIAYWGALIVANMLEQRPERFNFLYHSKLNAGIKVWAGRYQQKPRYVQPGHLERTQTSDLERAFYDHGWLD